LFWLASDLLQGPFKTPVKIISRRLPEAV